MEPTAGDKFICNMHKREIPEFPVTFVSALGQMWTVTRDSDGALMFLHRRYFRQLEGA